MNEIYLAGGCFWGVEKYFAMLTGVVDTKVGYANGHTENPTYEEVCHENTGHAETVKVMYDSNLTTLQNILEAYFKIIDPTSKNKQGPDEGIQYRTGIYYVNRMDKKIITSALQDLQRQYDIPLAVEAKPLDAFYEAEEYHQKYLDKNPTGYCHLPASIFSKNK
ncbi:MAG: peptide-methionine (S)-S-oxide reductase MsrA [Coprobacillaceae bacterium]